MWSCLPLASMRADCLCSFALLQVLLLENIGTSVKVGPDQLSSLHSLLVEAARILQMEPPELYVRQVTGGGGERGGDLGVGGAWAAILLYSVLVGTAGMLQMEPPERYVRQVGEEGSFGVWVALELYGWGLDGIEAVHACGGRRRVAWAV